MTFRANFPGRCGSCDDRIHAGDQVCYEDEALVHATCAPAPDRDKPRRFERHCSKCFCIHTGTECL